MTYQDSLDFIWSLLNHEAKLPATREPYKLDRMWALMARLGDPQARLPAIHIAGTKGKGSTSAMIEAVLRATGHRTGLFTSPHLHDPRERIQVGGAPIGEAHFVALVERLKPHIAEMPSVTTFEALTAMAFLAFDEAPVDTAVVEVGLGGRLDATNLLTPLVSVITRLDLEHTAVLGDTIEEIAAEKGGILKQGVPAATARQVPAALAVLRDLAAERNVSLVVADEAWRIVPRALSLDGQRFDLVGRDGRYDDLSLNLLGAHQAQNAALAVTALHLLRDQGIAWDEAALRTGLATVRWPARIEVLQRQPTVIADGAHTAESAAALAETLRAVKLQGWPHVTLVVGVSSDKKIGPLVAPLLPMVDRLIVTRSRHPRAAEPESLAADPALADRHVEVIPEVGDAVREAIAAAAPDALVLVMGSLFVAAAAREVVLGREALF